MIKVAICFPSGENVSSQFVLHLTSFLMRNTVPIAFLGNMTSSRIAFNRNGLVEAAKAADASHIWFIDADMTFPSDILIKLLAHDLDIVGTTASKRKDNEDSAVGLTLDGNLLQVPSSPVKMKWLGPCCMLIKMHVFEKLRAPWFAEPPRFMLEGEDPNDPGLMPEDEYFCWNAIKAGFDIYCDPELSMNIGHRGAKTYYIMKPQADPYMINTA